jgi:hypothetical protein
MPKRTYTTDIKTWDDALDLHHIVKDKRAAKRAAKRATDEKARRRNRRYEKRLLNAQLKHSQINLSEENDS